MGLDKLHIRTIFAPFYQEACLQPEVSMSNFTELMVHLETKFLSENPYHVWQRLTLNKQQYDTPFYVTTLTRIKERYYEVLLGVKIDAINDAFAVSNEAGFQLWEHIYLDALVHWNAIIFMSLCDETFPFSTLQKEQVSTYKSINHCILNAHWQPAQKELLALAKRQDLSNEMKANFLIYAGEIELYHILPDFLQAKKYIDKAHSIFPHDNTHRGLGEYHLKMGNFETAKTEFLTAIEMDPCDLENYLYLGDCYRDDGKEKIALQWYEDALQMNFLETLPYRRKLLMWGMNKSLDTNKIERQEIINRIDTLTYIHPYHTERYEFLRDVGHALVHGQQLKDSLPFYRKANQLHPNMSGAFIDIGYVYAQQGQFDQAEKHLLQAATLVEDHFDLYWALAYLYEQMEDWPKVISNYEKCLVLRPTQKDSILYNLGFYAEKAEDYSKAITNFQEAYALNSDYYVFQDALTQLLEKHGSSAELLEHLEKRISLHPENPLIVNDLGVFYSRKKDQKSAIPYFEKAIQLDPKEPVYFENLGLALENIGQEDKAMAYYQQAIKVAPNIGRYHNRVGYFYGSRGRYEEAIPFYEKAIEQEPSNSTYINNLGSSLNKLERFEPAINILKKAVSLDANNLTTNNQIGIAYLEDERYEEALPFLEKAAQIEPDAWIHQENLGVWNQRQGQYEEAILCYAKGIKINPKAHSIFNLVGTAYYDHSQFEEAIKYYKKAVALAPENETYKSNLDRALLHKNDSEGFN